MEIPSKLSFITFNKNITNYVIFGLIAILYTPIILHWIDGWLNKSISIEHEYYSHALLGFPLAIYITWQNRYQWQNLPKVTQPLGLVLLMIAADFYLTGVNDFVALSFPLLLTGLCLWLKGFPGLKLQAFPLLLVWLGTPTDAPYLFTNHTLFLQKFIATTAGFILSKLGFEIIVENIFVSVNGQLIEVAPYCAGLKMLFTSIYVTLMLLYWRNQLKSPMVASLVLLIAIFISVTGNIFRNLILAMFSGIQQQDLFDLLHEGWLGDLYSGLTLVLIFLVLRSIEKLNVE